MTFLKLKTVLYSLAIFSLFFGGFYAFCSLIGQDSHNNIAYAQESGASPVISETGSYCCTIQTHDSNISNQFVNYIILNRNSPNFDSLISAAFLFITFFSLFDKTKQILVARIYYLRQLIFVLHNHLLLAFSQGILHSKIYPA